MSLKDYLERLQEQDDSNTVYSATPETITKIIPPKAEPKKRLKLNLFKKPEEDEETRLFKLSGTDEIKKGLWIDYYRRALSSKKKNSLVEAMKKGRFIVTSKDEIFILPEMDVSGNSNDLLSKTWLNNKRRD